MEDEDAGASASASQGAAGVLSPRSRTARVPVSCREPEDRLKPAKGCKIVYTFDEQDQEHGKGRYPADVTGEVIEGGPITFMLENQNNKIYTVCSQTPPWTRTGPPDRLTSVVAVVVVELAVQWLLSWFLRLLRLR